MARPIYIFAGGGTGGHLYPGLAVAEALQRLEEDARIVFACSHRPIDRRILDPTAHAVVVQPVRPLPRRPGEVFRFLRAWGASWLQARQMVRDLRPAAVLGLGGFAAGPVVRRAAVEGAPTALINSDAVPGRANRYLADRCDVIFTQFPVAATHFRAKHGDKVRCVGCPVRAGIVAADRDEAMRCFALDPSRRTLLVLGGSQGARSVNEAVAALAADLETLADQWQVLHVTGPDGVGTTAASGAVRRVAYCERMDLAYAAADLALCRSGASTMAELAATGTPAVLMPYPYHADDQQRLNAAGFSEAGAGEIVTDAVEPAVNAEALRRELIPLMSDPARLTRMTEAAKAIGGQDAAEEVAAWLVGSGHAQPGGAAPRRS